MVVAEGGGCSVDSLYLSISPHTDTHMQPAIADHVHGQSSAARPGDRQRATGAPQAGAAAPSW